MRLLLPTLILLLAGLALADEPWEPTAERTGPVRWTREQAAGREVYKRQVCWQCHARLVRPLDDEYRRWGPVAWQSSDRPPPDLRGGIRFGADLADPPSPRSEDWLYACLLDPRSVNPRAVMASYPQLFDPVPWARRAEVEALIAKFDADGDGRVSFVRDRRPFWDEEGMQVARMRDLDVAGLSAPSTEELQTKSGMELWYHPSGKRLYADVWRPGEEQGDGILSLRDVRPRPTDDARALVTYLRGVEAPTSVDAPAAWAAGATGARGGFNGVNFGYLPGPDIVESRGRPAYARHCASCHGPEGRGDGPAAKSLDTPPTDLAKGQLKYARHSLFALEGVIRDGLPAAGMPGTAPDVAALAALVLQMRGEKPEERYWSEAPVMKLAAPDDWDGYMRHVLRGKAVYVTLGCNTCHGTEGRGDGPDAVSEFSDGRRVRARDFRPRDETDVPRRRLRSGAWPPRLHATIMDGLDEKGMPGAGKIFFGEEAHVGEDGLLSVPLKDERLFAVGVKPYTEGGTYQEVLQKLSRAGFGDDWALVLYVLHMARTQDEVARSVMAWPWIEVAR